MQTFVQPMGTLCDACPGHGQDHGTKGLRFVVNGCQATAPLEPRRAHVFRLKTGETIKAAGVFRAPLQAVTGQTQPRASAALLANSGDTDFRNTSRTWGWDFWWLQGFRHERIRVTSVLLG